MITTRSLLPWCRVGGIVNRLCGPGTRNHELVYARRFLESQPPDLDHGFHTLQGLRSDDRYAKAIIVDDKWPYDNYNMESVLMNDKWPLNSCTTQKSHQTISDLERRDDGDRTSVIAERWTSSSLADQSTSNAGSSEQIANAGTEVAKKGSCVLVHALGPCGDSQNSSIDDGLPTGTSIVETEREDNVKIASEDSPNDLGINFDSHDCPKDNRIESSKHTFSNFMSIEDAQFHSKDHSDDKPSLSQTSLSEATTIATIKSDSSPQAEDENVVPFTAQPAIAELDRSPLGDQGSLYWAGSILLPPGINEHVRWTQLPAQLPPEDAVIHPLRDPVFTKSRLSSVISRQRGPTWRLPHEYPEYPTVVDEIQADKEIPFADGERSVDVVAKADVSDSEEDFESVDNFGSGAMEDSVSADELTTSPPVKVDVQEAPSRKLSR